MNFFDTVTEMGYKVSQLEGIIDISKEDNYIEHEPLGEVHIVFYKKERKIVGFIKPLRDFYDIDDMCHIYKLYLNMQKDLKFFADRSKYDII